MAANKSDFDAATWPRDPANGRFLCSPEKPMPFAAPGQWAHTNIKSAGTCAEGCCDRYVCQDCGERWMSEGAD